MTYISAQVTENKKSVIVWERNENGERDYRVFNAPYYFYYQHDKGEYLDIYNKRLAKLEFSSSYEFFKAKEEFKNNGIKLYESDIGPEYKILSEYYYQKPIGRLNTTFFDIEVTKDPAIGYATINNPYAPVCSVALYHQYNDTFVIYAVPPNPSWTIDKIPDNIREKAEVVLCKDERQLLKCFLAEIENSDVISGWNSDWFDVPYLYFRIMSQLGETYVRQLGFPNAKLPEIKEVEKFGVPQKMIKIFGRISLDYLEVFKKLEAAMRPSYALEAIAEEMLPHLPKLEYEGSLQDLYTKDFIYFLQYNIRDTEILKGLEEKLKYAQFAVDFSHLATGLVENVLGTIKLTELTIVNTCHYEHNKKVHDINASTDSLGQYAGALVLPPQVGMHENGSAVDVVSLYPSMMRTLNTSPETIIGQFVERYKAYEAFQVEGSDKLTLQYENGVMESFTPKEWKQIFKENSWVISGFGTVYTQKFQGILPAILTDWFNKRKEYKGEMKKLAKELEKVEKNSSEYNAIKAKIDYFDKMQYVMKIRLNSIYGACGNPYFRFYDVRTAESVTRSGREVLMHMVRHISQMVDGEYTFPSESIIYGDTDSCYFKTHGKTVDEAVEIATLISKKVNAGFPEFLTKAFLCSDAYKNMVAAEYEFVFDRGIFVNKKLYVLHLAYADGKSADKMKIMGLQLKKTTIPKPISKQLIQFVEQLLKGRDWIELGKEIVQYKDHLLTTDDILQIGLPKGIKGIEDYTEKYNLDNNTRIPGHVAAAMFWNRCLDEYDDKESVKITSGSKLKVFYLTKPFGRFKSIAIPTDTKKVPDWFITHYLYLVDRKAQIRRLVDDPLDNIIHAIGKIIPTKKSLLVDELVEY